jgi:Concanavalin A-like lectin/glucanases superfamily
MKRILLPLFLFAAMHSMAQLNIPTYVPTDGLVGWWPFSGNAEDGSGNNNHGVVTNAALTTDRFGNNNAAYLFNGFNSLIEVADAASLRCRKLTISAWVKCTNISVGNQILYKGSRTTANSEAYALTLDNTGAPFSAAKLGSNCVRGVGWLGPGYGTSIDTGAWVHFVVTYDGDSSKLYKNGILETSRAFPGLIDSCAGGELRFGYDHNSYSSSTGNPFNGSIDDIAIWNRALGEAEITNLSTASYADCGYGKMGINVCNPQRNLHVKDVLRLEPRSTAPDHPGEGDIYYDSTLHKLRVYDGTQWQNCW